MTHANAPLTPTGRLRMVHRHLHDGIPQAHVAAEFRVSRPTVATWVARYRAQGEAGLQDLPSRPHRSPAQLDPGATCGLRRYMAGFCRSSVAASKHAGKRALRVRLTFRKPILHRDSGRRQAGGIGVAIGCTPRNRTVAKGLTPQRNRVGRHALPRARDFGVTGSGRHPRGSTWPGRRRRRPRAGRRSWCVAARARRVAGRSHQGGCRAGR